LILKGLLTYIFMNFDNVVGLIASYVFSKNASCFSFKEVLNYTADKFLYLVSDEFEEPDQMCYELEK